MTSTDGTETIEDVIRSKNAAVARLNRQIIVGMGLLESPGAAGKEVKLNDAVTLLTQERSRVVLQAYEKELGSQELADALKALGEAEAEMDKVASRMVTVTGYIRSAAQFVSASEKVAVALRP